MNDNQKTKKELIQELQKLRRQIAQSKKEKSAQMLHESEERYRAIFEGAAEGIVMADIETRQFKYVNPALSRMLGYSIEELEQMSVEDIHPKEALAHVISEFEAQAQGEKSLAANMPCLCRDGTIIYADINATKTLIDGKEYNVGFFTNITKRKLMEDEVRKFKAISDQANYGMAISDFEGNLIYVNEYFASVHGYQAEELLGKNLMTFQNREQAKEAIKIIQRVKKTGSFPTQEIWHKRSDGSAVPLLMNCLVIEGEDDQEFYVAFTAIDITPLKKAEEELKRRIDFEKTVSGISARFVEIADINNAINVSLAEMGLLAQAHRAYLFLIRPDDELIMDNTHEWCAKGVKPEIQNLQNLPLNRFPWWQQKLINETAIEIPDVSKLPRQAQAEKEIFESHNIKSLLCLPLTIDGKSSGFIGIDNLQKTGPWGEENVMLLRISSEIIANALARERTLKQLQKGKEQLEQRVKERTAELSDANIKLQEHMAERILAEQKLHEYHQKLRSLASQIALAGQHERRKIATELHDQIGQSLAVSLMQLESLRQENTGTNIDQPLAKVCQLLERTIQETRTMVFDLGSPVLYRDGFVAAVRDWLTEHVEKVHEIRCSFFDDGQPKPLDQDILVLLFQSVREILLNVVKHAQAQNIRVATAKENDYIKVTIEDDGVGFETERNGFIPGRTGGFGLFSIRERFDHFHGKLDIQSEPGQGTKVSLAAPLKHTNI